MRGFALGFLRNFNPCHVLVSSDKETSCHLVDIRVNLNVSANLARLNYHIYDRLFAFMDSFRMQQQVVWDCVADEIEWCL